MSVDVRIKQVLVVEDNPGDVALIREIFGNISNIGWHFVPNVVQARDFVAQRETFANAPRPDLIILDLKLPIFSGATLIPFIKKYPSLQDIRVVIFTSSESEKERAACLAMGADDFVTKPIELREWEQVVRKMLR